MPPNRFSVRLSRECTQPTVPGGRAGIRRVGARLRELWKERGLSAKEVASRAKVSGAYLSRQENGRISPTVSTLSRIVQAMGESVARVFGEDAAGPVVRKGDRRLRSLDVHGSVLVQSDGGSDFTGEVFQTACLKNVSWVRYKISQKGGMGVLERLNRTYKLAFAFRYDWQSLAEVQTALPNFHHWYNRERRHSALNYSTPWGLRQVVSVLRF